MYACVYVSGTNWRKINRCEEEQTDSLLSEVAVGVGVMGIEGGRYVKIHPQHTRTQTCTHTRPFFISKRADGLIPAPDPLILLRGMRENETVTKK